MISDKDRACAEILVAHGFAEVALRRQGWQCAAGHRVETRDLGYGRRLRRGSPCPWHAAKDSAPCGQPVEPPPLWFIDKTARKVLQTVGAARGWIWVVTWRGSEFSGDAVYTCTIHLGTESVVTVEDATECAAIMHAVTQSLDRLAPAARPR